MARDSRPCTLLSGRATGHPVRGRRGAGAAVRGPAPVLLLLLLTVASCDDDPSLGPEPEQIGVSQAYGRWSPGPRDTCSKAIHDAWSTVGPDGILYPTWHPPVDPVTGCTFGHEHGRDPSGSELFAEVGRIPFGYANEHLLTSGFGSERHEDHVGHKIEWENDIPLGVGAGGSAVLDIRCDLLVKMHQGTHSADAFTNNLHELAYHIRCNDGTGFSVTLLTPIGEPGGFEVSCERGLRRGAGSPNPLNSPEGRGARALPDATCVDRYVRAADGSGPRFDQALHESWETDVTVRAEGGRILATFNPYFQVFDPSRYFVADGAGTLARSIDLCYEEPARDLDRCAGLPGAEAVPWDDPRSPFKGVRRFVDVNGNQVRNGGGPTTWYTDPLGRNGQPFAFPGSVRQWIASRSNAELHLHGATIGSERVYDAPGVHAPN
ncbi:MAG TPA: hypothetical protein VLL48_01455 [Longimicrobiales bacterium]|nr:hypothetical protein [Longimicrobiales bacterium]